MLVPRGGKGLIAKGWQNGIFKGDRNVSYRDCCHGDYMIVHTCENSSTCKGSILLYANDTSIGQREDTHKSNNISFWK